MKHAAESVPTICASSGSDRSVAQEIYAISGDVFVVVVLVHLGTRKGEGGMGTDVRGWSVADSEVVVTGKNRIGNWAPSNSWKYYFL